MYLHTKDRIMPHRLPKLLFLVFLNIVVASPALLGRDHLGGDSLWGLDLDNVIGAGAAGFDAFLKLWDFSTAPGDPNTPSRVPSEQPDEMPPEAPDPMAFPLFKPTEMKTCAVAGEIQGSQFDRLDIENTWWQVEQEPETGWPVISACDFPKDDNNDAYIVHEVRLEEGRRRTRWPAAILVSDPVNNVYFRYNVIRVGKSTVYKYQKIFNAMFMRQGKIVKLGYVRRRGWLVGAGQQPKEIALKWFEDEILGTTQVLDGNIAKIAVMHFSAAWIVKAFSKADQSGSPYWIADR